jgi:hypothetical protein
MVIILASICTRSLKLSDRERKFFHQILLDNRRLYRPETNDVHNGTHLFHTEIDRQAAFCMCFDQEFRLYYEHSQYFHRLADVWTQVSFRNQREAHLMTLYFWKRSTQKMLVQYQREAYPTVLSCKYDWA